MNTRLEPTEPIIRKIIELVNCGLVLGLGEPEPGKMCVEAGQHNFRRLLLNHPKRYAYHEEQEHLFRVKTGKDVSIMKDRRGGITQPLTMRTFREEFEATGQYDTADEASGCGCAIDD